MGARIHLIYLFWDAFGFAFHAYFIVSAEGYLPGGEPALAL